MEFEIMYALQEGETKTQMDMDLRIFVDCMFVSNVDSENIYRVDVIITDIRKLKDLGYYFDDDIVIYGCDMDIITTRKTLKELGL